MSVRRVYQKAQRNPEQLAELRAVRERYQREKPSPEEALAQSGHERLVPLGEVDSPSVTPGDFLRPNR
jgi:hypothetical protein